MEYDLFDAERIHSSIISAIKVLIELRRPDLGWGILGGSTIVERANKAANKAINLFEPFWEYAYEGYYIRKHNDYNLMLAAKNMANDYNTMLDLCEPGATASNYIVNKYFDE